MTGVGMNASSCVCAGGCVRQRRKCKHRLASVVFTHEGAHNKHCDRFIHKTRQCELVFCKGNRHLFVMPHTCLKTIESWPFFSITVCISGRAGKTLALPT